MNDGQRSGTRNFLLCGASLWLIVLFGIGIIVYQSYVPPSQRSIRTFAVTEYGYQTSFQSDRFAIDPDRALAVGYRRGAFLPEARGCWAVSWTNLRQLAANNQIVELSAIVVGMAHSNIPGAIVKVYAGGVELGQRALSLVPHSAPPTFIDNLSRVEDVQLAPLDRVSASAFDLPRYLLQRTTLDLPVCVSVQNYSAWDVQRVGILLRYIPKRTLGLIWPSLIWLIGASTAICLLLSGVFLWAAHRLHLTLGVYGVCATAVLCVLGYVAQDQWDFPIWLNIVNIGAFHGGNTALYWSGTALWAYIPLLVAPLFKLAALSTWLDSIALDAYFLKTLFVIALLVTACVLYSIMRGRRRTYALMFLCSPLTLWMDAWGARDIFSGLAVALGFFLLSKRGKAVFISIVPFVAAAMIDEYYAPLLLAPGLFIVARDIRNIRAWIAGVGVSLIAFVMALSPWLLLPRAYVSSVLQYRIENTTNFGSASIQRILNAAGVNNALFGYSHGFALIIYGVLAICAGCFLRAAIRGNWPQLQIERRGVMLLCAILSAFFLWYQIADPQEWYGIAIVLFSSGFVIRIAPRVAVIFSVVAGIQIYAHFGFREFLNPYALQPVDVGLLGVRTQADMFYVLAALCLIAIITASCAAGKLQWLCGKATGAIAVAFVVVTGVTYFQPSGIAWSDGAILLAIAAILLAAMGDASRLLTLLRKTTMSLALANPVMSAIVAGCAAILLLELGPATVALSLCLVMAYALRRLLVLGDWVLVGLACFCVPASSLPYGDPSGIIDMCISAIFAILLICGANIVRSLTANAIAAPACHRDRA